MNILLRTDVHEYSIVHPHQVREGDHTHPLPSEFSAYVFLFSFAETAGNMGALRHGLFEAHQTLDVFSMSERDVIAAYAEMIARGLLRVTVTDIEPVHLDVGELSAEGQAKPGEAPPIEEKPAPIVPQEYVILARVECDEIRNTTRDLMQALVELLYSGFPRIKTPSQIARVYESVAGETSEGTRNVIEELDIEVGKQLHRASDLARPPSAVADELMLTAKDTGKRSGWVAESLSQQLNRSLYEPRELESPTPALPNVFMDTAELTSGGVRGAVGSLSANLNRLGAKTDEKSLPQPALPGEFKSFGESQAQKISATLGGLSSGFGSLLFNKNELNNIRAEAPDAGSNTS